MGTDKTGLAAFLASILTELSLLGKLAVFFGTVLVLWGIASPEPVKMLLGIGLLLFSVSNGYWQDRYRAIHYDGESRLRCAWGRVILALVFFIAFLLVLYFWLRLPAVTAFLRSIGVSF